MKKQALTLLAGILIGALLFGGITAIGSPVTAVPTPHHIFVDGKPVSVEAYAISGNNFFKLRDLLAAVDIGVWYEHDTKTVYIETDKPYDPDYQGPVEAQYKTENITVTGKRAAGIPSVLTIPGGDGPFPAVILCHGHGGSKDEAGGFVSLSTALAKIGVASIRMDFPGCGDSKEDFAADNNLTNMLDDVNSVKAFLAADERINMNKLGIIGYSMGGRIAMLTADETYKATVLWAPAGTPGPSDMFTFMQLEDQAAFDALYAVAKKDGKATYTAIFGFEQTLGLRWFDDMLDLDPFAAFGGYSGDVLTLYGDEDIIITPEVALAVSNVASGANSSNLVEVKGADHGFGMYSDEPEITQVVIDSILAFIDTALCSS